MYLCKKKTKRKFIFVFIPKKKRRPNAYTVKNHLTNISFAILSTIFLSFHVLIVVNKAIVKRVTICNNFLFSWRVPLIWNVFFFYYKKQKWEKLKMLRMVSTLRIKQIPYSLTIPTSILTSLLILSRMLLISSLIISDDKSSTGTEAKLSSDLLE